MKLHFSVAPRGCLATVSTVLFLLLPLAGFSATLRVPQDFATVQAAIDASVAGDTILVAPGLYVIPPRPVTLPNGAVVTVGLLLRDGTSLVGSSPAQTVLDFSGAFTGIELFNGTATVRNFHLKNASALIDAFRGSRLTASNLVLTDIATDIGCGCVGIELNQGISYVVHNVTIDNLHGPVGTGIDIPFGGSPDLQNNIVTNSDQGITPSPPGIYSFNDVFNSVRFDWGICTAAGCSPISPPPNNISVDPLYCPDFTLRPGSPAIDAGNPAILDPDGTRSDMGAYGGPDAIFPPLMAAPCVVDFGNVLVGTTSNPRSVDLRSTVSANQAITAISSNNALFSVTGGPALPTVVGPQGTATFGVTFSPQQQGDFSGEIQVSTSNPFPTRVRVKGRGTTVVPPPPPSGQPAITVSPTSLDFGNVPVSTVKSLSIEVLSSGTADLTVNSIETFFSLEDVPVLPTVLVPGESFAFEVVFAPQAQGTFSGNVAIFSDAPTSPTLVPVTGEGVPPQPPPGLRATVGNQRVYLDWDPSPDPVDGYNIQVARFNGSNFVSLGTVNPAGNLIQGTSFKVFAFANGEFVENGQLYRFTVTAVKNAAESVPSDEIFAVPGAFAIRHRPESPILFLHGLFSSASDAWEETNDFLMGTLEWRFGGELFNEGDTIGAQFRNDLFDSDGDFFTASFGDPRANYADGSGISHQAREVADFLQTLENNGVRGPKIVVAHSMGGLAVRDFLASFPENSSLVSHLVTYGTPHRGASFTFLESLIQSDGIRDMDFDCIGGQLVLSPFLDELRTKALPDIRYTSIIGHTHNNFFEIGTFLNIPLPPHRIGGCLSRHFDGVVPTDSANLRQAAVLRPRTHGTIITNRTHVKQTADISGFLCALDPNCLQFRLFSPVEIEVTAPDDRSISRGLSAIPGASYMEIEEGNGDASAIVLIPFPLSGDYTIEVSPKSGALPTDTFTLELTRAGTTTVLAEDRQIQDIPSEPFVASVFFIDIKPGSLPNSINPKSRGKIPVAVLSNPDFDAPNLVNRTSLTFGRTGDETSLAFCNGSPEDVNGDGLLDLVCHFDTVKAGFQSGDTHGVLKGQTIEQISIRAIDSVHIVPK